MRLRGTRPDVQALGDLAVREAFRDQHEHFTLAVGDPRRRRILARGWRGSSAGAARQYTGTSGKVDNCQVGVFAAYAAEHGRTLADRELYLPKRWTDHPERCAAAGVPAGREFATKPQIARRMIVRCIAAGLSAQWVAADEACGRDFRFRRTVEELGPSYVPAVPKPQQVPAG